MPRDQEDDSWGKKIADRKGNIILRYLESLLS